MVGNNSIQTKIIEDINNLNSQVIYISSPYTYEVNQAITSYFGNRNISCHDSKYKETKAYSVFQKKTNIENKLSNKEITKLAINNTRKRTTFQNFLIGLKLLSLTIPLIIGVLSVFLAKYIDITYDEKVSFHSQLFILDLNYIVLIMFSMFVLNCLIAVIYFIRDTYEKMKLKNIISTINYDEKLIITEMLEIGRKNDILFCTNYNHWTKDSKNILKIICSNLKYFKFKKVIVVSSIADSNFNYSIIFPKMSIENFKNFILELQGEEVFEIEESEMEFLYNELGTDTEALRDIIEASNSDEDNTISNIFNNKHIKKVIDKRSNIDIDNSLKYVSYIDGSFHNQELRNIIDTQKITSIYTTIINECIKLDLIKDVAPKKHPKKYDFKNHMIRYYYKEKASGTEEVYYTLAKMSENVWPYDYMKIAIYYEKASVNDDESLEMYVVYYILDKIKFVYNNGYDIEKKLNEIKNQDFDDKYIKFATTYFTAFNYFSKGQYSKAREEIASDTTNVSKLLKIEMNILKSLILSKSLNKSDRNDAYNILKQCIDSIDDSVNHSLVDRLYIRMIIVCVHNGRKKDANRFDHKYTEYVRNRLSYDNDTSIIYHSYLRTKNAICDAKEALLFTEESYVFFKNADYLQTLNYYKSLTNYCSELILNGKYDTAYEIASECINIENRFKSNSFPRTHIIRSNYAIAGLLSKKISPKLACKILSEICNSLDVLAERIFFTCNYAIFCALDNQLDLALRVLNSELKEQEKSLRDDEEMLYNNAISLNLAIFNYLAGNNNEVEINLNRIKMKDKNLLNYNQKEKQFEMLKEAFNRELHFDCLTWLNYFRDNKSNFSNQPSEFFDLGFAFVTLSTWDL